MQPAPQHYHLFHRSSPLTQELQRYELLLQQLRGKRPADLLPPAPAAYLLSRLLSLASGTCVPEFHWSGGGTWAGRPWSSDLPNDGAVLLYLFSAFLDTPGWEVPARGLAGHAGDADVARCVGEQACMRMPALEIRGHAEV